MSTDSIMPAIHAAIDTANDLGTRYGFEMAKLAVVALLYDEMTRADYMPPRELIGKVQALQMPAKRVAS
jgi:hypothetical protein